MPAPGGDDQHGKVAQAVAALLSPYIRAVVHRAVVVGIEQLRMKIGEQAWRLSEVEQRLSDVEDEIHQSQLAS